MSPLRAVLLTLLLLPLTPAAGAGVDVRLDLPEGTLGQAVAALGRQAKVSVAVADDRLWRQRVPAVRGRMSVREALGRLLRDSQARATPIEGGWRIAAAPARMAARARRSTARPLLAAPTGDPAEAGEIVVTGSKRDVRLAEFPGTVSLIEGSELAFGGERGTDSILSRLATVSSTHFGAGRNKLFIRGIADSSFTGPTQATVGQYLGDIRLAYNAPDPDLRLYDIASVEVLEGPQGTLYGAGSLGGIIRILRNPPRLGGVEASLSTGLSATAHGDIGGDVGGMVNLPLLDDRAALRVVAYGISEGGYIDAPASGRRDINRTRIAGGRATLRFDAGDDWTVDLGGVVQDTSGADGQYADRDAPPLTRSSALDQGFSAHYRLGDLVVAKRWDGLNFLSSTGIVAQRLAESYDATLPEGPERLFQQRNDTMLISSENRLWRPTRDGFGWVLGGSFIHNRTRLRRALGPVDMPAAVTGVTNRIDEATLYGEASLALVPGLTATIGGRVTHTRLSGAGEDLPDTAVSVPEIAARAMIVGRRRTTAALPSGALAANVLPDLILFARYQQGFRPGGLAIAGDFVQRFRDDRVATLESGLRYGAPGRGASDFSASLSHTRWRDIQADFIDAGGLPTTANIGDGRIYSFAAAGGWRPLPGLGIDAAFAFNDSRVTDPSQIVLMALQAGEGGRLGRIPNVARYAARIGLDYRTALSDALDLHVAASARYVGRSRLGIGPVLGQEQGDYLDTTLTARVGGPRLGVTLALTNLSDEIGNRFALGTPFAEDAQITPLRPRTIRIGIDAAF